MADPFLWLKNYTNKIWGNTFGKFGEKGWDIGIPWGNPIASPVNGMVTAIDTTHANDSIGTVVQIRQQGTIKGGISGGQDTIWHFQHLMAGANGLKVGSPVTVGQVIGYSGGCPASGYGNNPSTCASLDPGCPFGKNCYSTGPHIEVREAYVPSNSTQNGFNWNYNWINPSNDLSYYANATGKLATKDSPTASPGNIPTNIGMQKAPCNDILASAYANAAQDNNVATSTATKVGANIQYAFCQIAQTFVNWSEHIAVFAIGVLLIILGVVLLSGKEVTQLVKPTI